MTPYTRFFASNRRDGAYRGFASSDDSKRAACRPYGLRYDQRRSPACHSRAPSKWDYRPETRRAPYPISTYSRVDAPTVGAGRLRAFVERGKRIERRSGQPSRKSRCGAQQSAFTPPSAHACARSRWSWWREADHQTTLWADPALGRRKSPSAFRNGLYRLR